MARDGADDGRFDVLEAKGFGDVSVGALLDQLFGRRRFRVTGNHNHGNGRVLLLNLFQDLMTAQSGHRDVSDDNVIVLQLEVGERLFCAIGPYDTRMLLREDRSGYRESGIVIDD